MIEKGGDVWVLVIKNARMNDAGVYVCEINSNPVLRSFHTLNGSQFNSNLTTQIQFEIIFKQQESISIHLN